MAVDEIIQKTGKKIIMDENKKGAFLERAYKRCVFATLWLLSLIVSMYIYNAYGKQPLQPHYPMEDRVKFVQQIVRVPLDQTWFVPDQPNIMVLYGNAYIDSFDASTGYVAIHYEGIPPVWATDINNFWTAVDNTMQHTLMGKLHCKGAPVVDAKQKIIYDLSRWFYYVSWAPIYALWYIGSKVRLGPQIYSIIETAREVPILTTLILMTVLAALWTATPTPGAAKRAA